MTENLPNRKTDDLIGRPPPSLGAQLARLHLLTAQAAAAKAEKKAGR